MHIEVNRTLNELDILSLIYEAENEQVRKLIEAEMLAVQRRVMESTKASSGLFSRFIGGKQGGKSSVSLTDAWTKLGKCDKITKYKHLVKEISELKGR